MSDRPPGAFTHRRSVALLAVDKDPAARVAGTDLLAVKRFRVSAIARSADTCGGPHSCLLRDTS